MLSEVKIGDVVDDVSLLEGVQCTAIGQGRPVNKTPSLIKFVQSDNSVLVFKFVQKDEKWIAVSKYYML